MRRALLSISLFALVGFVAAACGTTTGNTAPAAKSKPPAVPAKLAHVGATVAAEGSNGVSANVTLVKVIDPAESADPSSETPGQGNRFVGLVLRITCTGSSTLSSDADECTTVIGSDEQTYTASLDSIAGYTDFNAGEFTLQPGQSTVGAVAFQIPETVKVARVAFDLNEGLGGSITVALWQVP